MLFPTRLHGGVLNQTVPGMGAATKYRHRSRWVSTRYLLQHSKHSSGAPWNSVYTEPIYIYIHTQKHTFVFKIRCDTKTDVSSAAEYSAIAEPRNQNTMCRHRTAKELTLAYGVVDLLELIPIFLPVVGKN